MTLLNYLKSVYKKKIIPQYKFADFAGNYSFDFFLPDINLIIELDGDQHFKQVSNWKSPESAQINDRIKMDYLLEKKISLIRILQTDVYCDVSWWRNELMKYISYKPSKFFFKFLDEDDTYTDKYIADDYFHLNPKFII
jgi:hypothetical protein